MELSEGLWQQLVARYFPDDALDADRARWRRDACQKWMLTHHCRVMAVTQSEQFGLSQIAFPPTHLFLQGSPDPTVFPALAIVGTRLPSIYGIRGALHFAQRLSQEGFWIVSGLARGIDSAAHRGALLGSGKTIAVMGCGLDRIYPLENAALAQEIVENGGLLVSEYPPFVPPRKAHFPARNRILAGLALGTLVVEAAERSGSLLTARFAMEQGREVFAVPSHFDDAAFSGSHQLIQNGAKLVRSAEDVLSELQGLHGPWRAAPLATTELELWLASRPGGASLGEAVEAFGLSTVATVKLLEDGVLSGKLCEVSAQRYVWLGTVKASCGDS